MKVSGQTQENYDEQLSCFCLKNYTTSISFLFLVSRSKTSGIKKSGNQRNTLKVNKSWKRNVYVCNVQNSEFFYHCQWKVYVNARKCTLQASPFKTRVCTQHRLFLGSTYKTCGHWTCVKLWPIRVLFGRDVWMATSSIHRSVNHLKCHHEGEMNVSVRP